jgi:CRP/FNR family cyclic AMP-dependent transcriptional regulator
MTKPVDEILAEVPLFSQLDEGQRKELAARLDRTHHKEGDTLFLRGDPGHGMYVVVSGEAEIFFKNDTGDRIVLERCTSGHFVGEISLLDEGPRTASAVVTADMEALLVDRGDLADFLDSHPRAAMKLLAAMGIRLRQSAELLRHSASRNINEETEDRRTRVMKVADWISDFSGSLPFLFIHLGVFFVWIITNVPPLANTPIGGYDPFPFGLLTMVVSLEAIVLSVFVLLSQNRQVARDRVRNDIEYDVNLKSEREIAHLHEKFDELHEMIAKFSPPSRSKRPPPGASDSPG